MTATPLVSADDYARETRDSASQSSDITDALTGALAAVDEHCRRKFAYAEYTETLYVYPDGKVYPTNTPLASVSSPANIPSTGLQGAGIYLGVFLPVPAMINSGDWNAAVPPQASVTYMGGYQPYGTTDGATDALPWSLMRAVCRIAYLTLHPVALPGMPAGAKSASVGGLTISGDLSPFIAIDPSIGRDLNRYIKRQARGWQRA